MTLKTVLATALLVCATGASACPTGAYEAVGTNPAPAGRSPTAYRADVTIRDAGNNVCTVDWDLGGQRFSGVGFYDPSRNTLNIAYANIADGWFGQINYEVDGSVLTGKWTVYSTTANLVGTERLTRR